MKAWDIFGYSMRNLTRRKLRSWLTIIGILLGIATIVVLVSIGEGVNQGIGRNLNSLGADMITVSPGGGAAMRMGGGGGGSQSSDTDSTYGKLFEKDADRVEKVIGVSGVSMSVSGRETIMFGKEEISASVTATESGLFELFPDTYALEKGRYISSSEEKAVVIGYGVANDMFGSDVIGLNEYIEIGDEPYRVVGILEETGTNDRAIYVPYDEKDTLFGDTLAKDEIGQITVKIRSGQDSGEAGDEITEKLALARGVDEENPDFTVRTSESAQEAVSDITGTLTIALLLIGMISATVGGIGIANTMFMTVLERTKEVGILKSIGASSRQILALFMIEAGMIGGTGGLMGLALGIIVIQLIPMFVGLTPCLSAEVAVGSVLFAVVVGIFAGVVPARNAARIPAIEALSYD